jgi:TRAP transporter TAXI family solute receptor
MKYINYIFIFSLLFITESFAMPIKIGTGDKNLYFYNLGLSICQEIAKEKSVPCEVVPTKGSIENLILLKNKKIDIALVQSDILWMAQNNELDEKFSNFDDIADIDEIEELAKLQLFILSNNTDIHNFSDLKGKKVNFGPINSGLRGTMLYLAKKFDISLSNTKIMDLPASKQTENFCKNELDAMAFILPSDSKVITETLTKCPMHFVTFSESEINQLIKLPIGYQKVIIPEKTYLNQDTPITTISMDLLQVQ